MTNVPVNTSGSDVEKVLRIPGGKRGDFGGKHAGPERKWSKASMIETNSINFASFSHYDLVTMQSNEGEWVADSELM